jgi:thiamine biosynthesis lipoprotein
VESSDISRINRLPASRSTRIGTDTFDCLQLAARVHRETRGAFDVTMGPVIACWKDANPDGLDSPVLNPPPADDLDAALERVGMELLDLDPSTFSVRAKRAGMQIDLGGIGKGFALDKAAAVLREWGMDTALLHGGESTALALGAPPGRSGWLIGAGRSPYNPGAGFAVALNNAAVSGSGLERRGHHIFDPRTGTPARVALAAWALCPRAAISDALSTAFMVMGADEVERYCAPRAQTSGMVLVRAAEGPLLKRFGDWPTVNGDSSDESSANRRVEPKRFG